jgi:hypothetical protein
MRPDFDPTTNPEFVKTPDPDWKPGGGLNNLVSKVNANVSSGICTNVQPYAKDFDPTNASWRVIDPEEHSRASLYKVNQSGVGVTDGNVVARLCCSKLSSTPLLRNEQ